MWHEVRSGANAVYARRRGALRAQLPGCITALMQPSLRVRLSS